MRLIISSTPFEVMVPPVMPSTLFSSVGAPPFKTLNKAEPSTFYFLPLNLSVKKDSLISAPKPGVSVLWSKLAPKMVVMSSSKAT